MRTQGSHSPIEIDLMKRGNDNTELNIDWEQFLMQLVKISYDGDIRFAAGAENPNKVRNIVFGCKNELMGIYGPIIKELHGLPDDTLRSMMPLKYRDTLMG